MVSTRNLAIGACAIVLRCGMAPASADTGPLDEARFSRMAPGGAVTGWRAQEFRRIPRHTAYTLVQQDGVTVLQADARASASGLVQPVAGDAAATPRLTWRWKVSGVVKGADPTRRSGDDFAARVYVTFAAPPGARGWLDRAARALYGPDLPYSGLAYVWDNRLPPGTVVPNAHTDRLRMIVVRSGTERAGEWLDEEVDIVADYRRAFGSEPPPLSGIAVMTDTDDTGESVTAWYGDVRLLPRGP